MILYHNFGFIEYFNYGWLGVDLFFVLSGFLITDILLTTVNTPRYFRNFYARRVLRIFPLYYLVLVLFIFVFPLFPRFILYSPYYPQNQGWFWLYFQNWLFIVKPAGNISALFHFWSLAVEEQFYLVWPLLVFLLKKPGYIFITSLSLLVLVVTFRIEVWNFRSHFNTYEWILLFTRFDGILIGAMLASLMKSNPGGLAKRFTSFLVLLTIGNLVYYLFKRNMEPDFPVWSIGGYTSFCFLFAIITYEAVSGKNRVVSFVLRNPVLRMAGRYSYGLYVIHMPVKIFLQDKLGFLRRIIPETDLFLTQLSSAILISATAFLLSIVSYHLFEKQFLKLKKYF